MNENITRIADLPDHYSAQSSQSNDLGLQNSYIPMMNVHPNPYGNTNMQQPPYPQSCSIDSASNGFNNTDNIQLTVQQKEMIDHTPMKRLPSRDIKIEPIQIFQDEKTHANYIPADDLSNDFLYDYEKNKDRKLEKH